MYEKFYGMRTTPFSISPDPAFLYWARAHSMAFTMLEYGILTPAGLTVITGEIGSGKTTLVRHLLTKLSGDTTVGVVSSAAGEGDDLLQWAMMSLGLDFSDHSYVKLYRQFEDFLIRQYTEGKKTVLIIDEAQNLSAKALEKLRMISNINADKPLVQMILVGQPELKALLRRPDLVQFAQRVTSDFHLSLLSREEVPAYIDHRLAVAGCDRPIFSEQACELVHTITHGTPRLINVICDRSLMYGFASGAPFITAEIVRAVLADKEKYGVISVTNTGHRDASK